MREFSDRFLKMVEEDRQAYRRSLDEENAMLSSPD